ncbi:MAG: Do family serine endopeptidase [Cytophagaceae bacterium]
MSTRKVLFLVVFASVFGGLLSLFGYTYFFQPELKMFRGMEESVPVKLSAYAADTNYVVPEGLNFIYAAELSRPAVVHIKTFVEVASNKGNYPVSPFDDMLKEFFGDRLPDRNFHGGGPREASGSGVILTRDGYIVTNNHVIEGSDKIEVVLNDKRSYSAKLIGSDPTTDLAVIKIEESNLPTVNFGNSDKVKIGEWVLAVGNPFNLTSTVTAGIVSAKARNINILRDKDNLAIESFIQTDAVVNPGNSGGALVNLKGELIGINTAIASPTGSYTGYSFAVPSALVKKVVGDIVEYGTVQRALLGVSIQDISSTLAKEKGISEYTGVYIAAVNSGSAADKAGLKEGDIITHINGVAVNSASSLQENVARFRPGDKVKVSYLRNGKTHEAEAVLKNKMGDTELVKKEVSNVSLLVGAGLRDIGREEIKKYKVDAGVLVEKVNTGKFKEAGIKEGFVITSVDKHPVNNTDQLLKYLEKNKSEGTLIGGVYPDGKKAYYAIAW